MKKTFILFLILITIVSCKKGELVTKEGTYSGNLTLTTVRQGIPSTHVYDTNMLVEFKGNNFILIKNFFSEKIPYNTSQKTFRKEQGKNEYYYGYFANDSLFLEFKGAKSGTTYFYNLKKNI